MSHVQRQGRSYDIDDTIVGAVEPNIPVNEKTIDIVTDTSPSPRNDSHADQPQRSLLTSYIFMVNFILGSGVLAIPNAFRQAGIMLGAIFTVVVTFLAYLTMAWLLEVQARLQCIRYAYAHKWLVLNEQEAPSNPHHGEDTRASNFSQLLSGKSTTLQRNTLFNPEIPRSEAFDLENKKIREIKELVHVFGGPRWVVVWDVGLILYMWSSLWLYCAVWCSSLLVVIPIPNITSRLECDPQGSQGFTSNCFQGYHVFNGVFFVVLGVLAVMPLKHMDKIQTFLTGLAYSCLLTMVATITVAWIRQPYNDEPKLPTPVLFDFSGFNVIFAATLFAQLCHMGSPTVTREVPTMKKAKTVYAMAFSSTCVIYILLGITAAWYFGTATQQVVTMNWINYTMEKRHDTPAGATIISTIIILFPVFTTSAAYVLMTRTLATTMESILPLRWKVKICTRFSSTAYTEGEPSPVITALTRFIAFAPPVGCAAIVPKATDILNVAGMFGFVIMFFAPCLLQIRSHAVLKQLQLPTKTIYDEPLSNPGSAWVVFVVMVVGFGYYVFVTYIQPST